MFLNAKSITHEKIVSKVNKLKLDEISGELGFDGIARTSAIALQFLKDSALQEIHGSSYYHAPTGWPIRLLTSEVSKSELLSSGFHEFNFNHLASRKEFKSIYFYGLLSPQGWLTRYGLECARPIQLMRLEEVAHLLNRRSYNEVLDEAFSRFLVASDLFLGKGTFIPGRRNLFVRDRQEKLSVVDLCLNSVSL